jgi:hypothetical protein
MVLQRLWWIVVSLLSIACVASNDTAPTPSEPPSFVTTPVFTIEPEPQSRATKGELPDACVDGPSKPLSTVPKIFYGTDTPTHVDMSPEQIWAVGWFGGCSGALIKENWVLSASHCNGFWSGGVFCVSKDGDHPDNCVAIEEAHDHPNRDLSLIRLSQSAKVVLPGIEPIPLMVNPLGANWIGVRAEAAGYGQQENGYSGERQFSAEDIVQLSEETVTIYADGESGACFGDSGGPLLVIASDGSTRVAGTLSAGDESCVGYDYYTRVDKVMDWITDRIGPIQAVGPQPCGKTTHVGHCNQSADRASYCGGDDFLHVDKCTDGRRCSWDLQQDGWRCVLEAQDPCIGITHWGQCEENILTWCDEGGLKQRNCGACNESCVAHEDVGFVCVPSSCGDLDFAGVCHGSVVEWCNLDGEVETRDCANEGLVCGLLNEEKGHWCTNNNCGDIDHHGFCDEAVATWCDDGAVNTKDCGASGQICGWVNENQGYYCGDQPCGEIDYYGACAGDEVQWCQDGTLKTQDCGDSGQSCGLINDEVGKHCLPVACGSLDFYGYCDDQTVRWCNRDGQPDALDCTQHDQVCGLLEDDKGYYCVDP